ncbi:cytochrome P450, partial [Dunaliella salina]
MWAQGDNGRWIWVAVAATTATTALVLTTSNFGILRGMIVSWRARKLPGWPADLISGNAKQLFRSGKSFHNVLKAGVDEYGPLYKLRLFCFTVVVVTDPPTCQELLRPGPKYLPKAIPPKTPLQKLLGGGPPVSIASAPDGIYHRTIRRALSPAFAASSLKQVFPDALDLSQRAADYLANLDKGKNTVDIDNISQRITVDLIGRMVFGVDFGATQFDVKNDTLDTTNMLFKSMQGSMNPLNRWIPFRKEARAQRYWQKKFLHLAGDVVRHAKEKPAPPGTLMSALLNLTDPETGKKLTDRQLKAEVGILLIAGFETTAHSIAWTLMCLACHEEALKPVLQELDGLGLLASKKNPSPRAVDWSDLGKLKELDAAINEGLRLFPAVSSGPTTRRVTQDMELLGYTIPKGALVMMPTWAVHRSQEVWGADVHEFKPQRWLGKQEEGANPVREQAFMPFSHGPRNCVGQTLAILELRAVLATLLGRIRFQLSEEMGSFQETAEAARQFITLQPTIPRTSPPQVGLLLQCTPRSALD